MSPLMYKHRPAYPALIAALVILLLGVLVDCGLKSRVDAGEGDGSTLIMVGCLSFATSGSLIIVAFARYRFTHLWKKSGPAPAKKSWKNRKRR